MSNAAARRSKIEAAAPKGGGGANRAVVATVVAVLVIAAVVTAVILSSRGSQQAASTGGSTLPKNVAAMGAGIVVNPGAPANVPTMDLYEDFQCPVCGRFEQLYGTDVTQLAAQNKVKLVIHTLSFLDDNLRNDSSNRAANAAACAADDGKFLQYHAAVFAGQPAKEGAGYTDAQLASFAQTAGITGSALTAWQSCYSAKAHNQYVQSVQTQADKDGVNGTPTIKLNGATVALSTLTAPQSLDDAVKAATK
ncbi:thioredoxin domain-containing protein [Nostocoides sp. HKS02]|uniref:DsbA family protein n=1 Tax=Nostocoides sp. HKS02 TaxID=1813880 RepID=UPI0012B4F907|nr:thioredoxin domain-containing protein [Tetrasphaera sp. HKS02]QGN57129.1 thioredoxin domain-containing protein [Tetrasphaera sp. HKS02]